MEAFFFCVKDTVIDWELIAKPRYSIDLTVLNIDLSGWTTNPRPLGGVAVSLIFAFHIQQNICPM